MSSDQVIHPSEAEPEIGPEADLEVGSVGVAVRHDVRGVAVVAVVAAVLTLAWFSRALGSGDALDWALTLVPAAVGALMLAVLRDSRAPLLVADDQGVRVRRGVTWTGLRWSDVSQVEVRGRRALRDRALVLHVAGAEEIAVPLGLGTRVETEGLTGDLVEDLASLASGLVPVVVLAPADAEPEPEHQTEPEPDTEPHAEPEPELHAEPEPAPAPVVTERMQVVVLPTSSSDVLPTQAGPVEDTVVEDAVREDTVLEGTVREDTAAVDAEVQEGVAEVQPFVGGLEPDRATRGAARAEVRRDAVRRLPDPPAIPAQRVADLEVVTARIEDRHLETGPQPAADPVIGPLVAAARHRARLTIDTLSERTRIRPHVLECIEVDDFTACGGDFYARGHLRTLARVFGLDAEQLVSTYDARYAHPEIEAKQVFEAELASGIGGGVRTATSGPRWSMLAAAVVLLVGIWGTARVFSDDPEQLVSPAPDVVDTAGLAGQGGDAEPTAALSALRVTAQGASPQVVVRDGDGRIIWSGKLADGQSQQVIGTGPFDVTASNGQAVQVAYLGKDRGTVGDSEAADNRRFG